MLALPVATAAADACENGVLPLKDRKNASSGGKQPQMIPHEISADLLHVSSSMYPWADRVSWNQKWTYNHKVKGYHSHFPSTNVFWVSWVMITIRTVLAVQSLSVSQFFRVLVTKKSATGKGPVAKTPMRPHFFLGGNHKFDTTVIGMARIAKTHTVLKMADVDCKAC